MKDRIARLWGKLRGRKPIGPSATTLGEGVILDGRFAIKSLLGIGGTSAVYVAEQLSMGRQVALKVLRSELLSREQATERFVREVRAVSRLTSPHTIAVYDVGRTPEGLLYIAMELLKGRSLFRVMTEDPMPMSVWRAVRLVEQVLHSLGEAHEAGVLHRDLKPENIFVLPGPGGTEFAKVLDFGIAQLGDDAEGRESERGIVVGTPRYMSPEQMQGKPLDPRSDLYSLATILFEMVAGSPPFEAPNPVALALRKIQEDPPLVREVNPQAKIPGELEVFLQRALARDPERRPRDASEFKNLLLLAVEGHKETPQPTKATPASRKVSRGPVSQSVLDSRKHPRIRRMLGVTFFLDGEVRATTLDISAGGAFIFSQRLPPVGAQVEFAFDNPKGTAFKVHLLGEVVRVVERPTAPGEVRGFAVRWIFGRDVKVPETLEEIFQSG